MDRLLLIDETKFQNILIPELFKVCQIGHFKKMKFFMSTEKIYNITEFDFRLKTITDSGSNNSNENINNVIMKVIC